MYLKTNFQSSLLFALLALSCSGTPPGPSEGQPPPASTASFASASTPPEVAPTPPAASAPLFPASSAGAAAAPEAPPSAAFAAPPAPLPSVKVVNIGMHIGGGPNDAPTKEPIKRSVEPHFDALRRCFALVDDPKKGGDFGADIRIERNGGKARISHPRTALKGNGFQDCVIKVLEGIDFLKPKGGATMVSYSIRFTPM
jgi:hypothetical protein